MCVYCNYSEISSQAQQNVSRNYQLEESSRTITHIEMLDAYMSCYPAEVAAVRFHRCTRNLVECCGRKWPALSAWLTIEKRNTGLKMCFCVCAAFA